MLKISGINQYPKFQNVKLNSINTVAQFPSSKPECKIPGGNFDIAFRGRDLNPRVYPLPYIENYVNPKIVQNALDTNPIISFILDYNGIEPKINEVNIDDRLKNHLLTTYIYAKEIANQINLDSESKEILYRAALLHDIGKALIPESIVQKPGKLTEEERKIIDLHAKLGYEILKTTDVHPDAGEAIRLHHAHVDDKNKNDIAQILSVADVFSALKEERAYKPPMSNSKAFEIMADTPSVSQNYVNILKGMHI